MTAIKKMWEEITGLWSLIVGLKVTGKNFADKQITMHYPRETVGRAGLEGFRGPLELIPKPKDPEKPKCIACMMCVTACPSKCITVVKTKPPKLTPEQEEANKLAEANGEKVIKPKAPKAPSKFTYDYSLCSLCGSCVENCPVNSLRFSDEVYLTSFDRKEFKMDLLKKLETKSEKANS